MSTSCSNCPNCQRTYDATSIPLELPCGHCYCEKCLAEYAESRPNKVKCFSENKEYTIKISSLKVPYEYCKLLLAQPQESSNTSIPYTCSKHTQETIKCVCDKHLEFICSICILEHGNHKDLIRIYLEADLMKDLEKVELKLKEMAKVMDYLKLQLKEIKTKKINNSKELKEFFEGVEKFITTPFSPTGYNENKNFPLVVKTKKINYTKEALERLEKAQRIFKMFDTSSDGKLGKKEVKMILIQTYKEMGMHDFNPTNEDIDAFIELLDTNQDGLITLEDYENYILKSLKKKYEIIIKK